MTFAFELRERMKQFATREVQDYLGLGLAAKEAGRSVKLYDLRRDQSSRAMPK